LPGASTCTARVSVRYRMSKKLAKITETVYATEKGTQKCHLPGVPLLRS
jgi:hypothetical protein